MALEPGIEYPKEIKSFVTGDVPLEQMGTGDIETILYMQAVSNRTPDDVVLIYTMVMGFLQANMGEPI